jgi:hypothetical protein
VIRRLHAALPGPPAIRTLFTILIVLVAVGLLILFYEWVGNTFLDSGGTIG